MAAIESVRNAFWKGNEIIQHVILRGLEKVPRAIMVIENLRPVSVEESL